MSHAIAKDSEHRRGLILGLTLAEVLMLLLFLVLLALSARVFQANQRVKDKEAVIDNLSASLATLQPLADELSKTGALSSTAIADLVTRLSRTNELEKQIESVTRRNKELETDLSVLKTLGPSAVDDLRSVAPALAAARKHDPNSPPEFLKKAVEIAGGLRPSSLTDLSSLISALEKEPDPARNPMRELREALQAAALVKPDSPIEALKDALDVQRKLGDRASIDALLAAKPDIDALRRDLTKAHGDRDQYRKERDNLMRSGRGLVFPSCWIADSGETEYLFDATLNDTGLVVADAGPEYRRSHPIWNILGAFPRNAIISESIFSKATAPAFEWSKQQECRFIVKLRDNTGAQSKDRYKRLRQVVENHFYIRLVDQRAR